MNAEDNEGEVLAFAQWQLERELSARQKVARGAGLALIELTGILEEEHATLDPSVDPLGIVLVAYAARGRRLLRSAYRLLDAGELAEAVPLLRVISEYLVVGRWLLQHPDRLEAWALADLDKRDYIIGQVMAELTDGEDSETVGALQEQRDELREGRERWLTERGQPKGDVVNVEQMAAQIGLGFAYQLAYRTQSQVDVHATTVAVDSCYERLPDGRLRLLPAPVHALSSYDQYEIGAHMLRDLLATTNAHVRSFLWTTGLDGITAALNSLRESDPRKYAEPGRHIVQSSEAVDDSDEARSEDAAAGTGTSGRTSNGD